MNNIYVETIPENCLDCEFCSKRNYGCILMKKDVREYRDECPLNLLSDRLAEERKKVVCDIKEKLVDGTSCEILPTGDICISLDKINNVLDKIERGTDD